MTGTTGMDPAGRMRQIAEGLRAAGLDVRLQQTRAGWDLAAVLAQPGNRESEAVLDDDGYVELRYWNPPGATPAQIAEVITRALAAVHASGPPGEGQ